MKGAILEQNHMFDLHTYRLRKSAESSSCVEVPAPAPLIKHVNPGRLTTCKQALSLL